MRYHARQFLADWEFEHIKGVARANREEHARLLAEKCRDDAAKAGINKWALEIVAGGDLIRKLIGALNEAEFRHTAAISGPTRGFRLDFLRTPRSSGAGARPDHLIKQHRYWRMAKGKNT